MNSEVLDWSELNAAQKLTIKYVCEQDFMAFHRAMYAMGTGLKWNTNWHHKYIAHYVQKMMNGEMPGESLIISVPPGSGKTELLSISAPLWGTVRCKKMRNLHVSFADSLAKRNSRRMKEVINSKFYQDMWSRGFGVNQAEEWQLLDTSGRVRVEVFARSMGGQITGARGGFPGPEFTGSVTLDDPNKPEDMFSSARRDRDKRTLSGTLFSRRAERNDSHPTPFIIIQQRLHVDDITGFILAGGLGKSFKYKHIVVPALIDQAYIDSLPDWIRDDCIRDVCGSDQVNGYWSFHPGMVGINEMMSTWEADPYTFMSQYMQRPYKVGGSIIKEGWWKDWGDDFVMIEEDGPSGVIKKKELLADEPMPAKFEYRFITADTAHKTKEINDFSVFCEWGYANEKLYLLDIFRDKLEAPELRQAFIDFCDTANAKSGRWGAIKAILVEDKASGTGLIQELKDKLPVRITALQRSIDKLTRAMSAAPMIKAGKVLLPYAFKQKNMKNVVVSELTEFSADDTHKHDDICDNFFDAIDYCFAKKSNSSGVGMMIGLMKK